VGFITYIYIYIKWDAPLLERRYCPLSWKTAAAGENTFGVRHLLRAVADQTSKKFASCPPRD
jgi:hypothetical protein